MDAQGHTSHGVGRKLYGALMELLAIQGVRTVYGIVTVPNEKSEGLHRSMGFQDAGICRNTGYVDGAWRDVQTFEKAIGPYDLEPVPITPSRSSPRSWSKGFWQNGSKKSEHSAGKCSRFFIPLFPL